MSSGRAERNTRSQQRHESNGASATPRSASSAESLESKDKAEPDTRRTRQFRRGQDSKSEEATPADAQTEDVEQDEDEDITRCICRKPEYPGPPVPLTTTTPNDEPGSLFIQCESCNVWQHGGCVGIMDESMSPENYWCERCRSDLHKIMTGPRGQRYSNYLPVTDPKSVRKKGIRDVDSRMPQEGKQHNSAQMSNSAKRRSTMNSRSTWEEEENFRKALEESKGGGGPGEHSANGSKRNKRIRDESDNEAPELKRQRTGSGSASVSDREIVSGDDGSDAQAAPSLNRTEGTSRRNRGGAAQNQQEKDSRRREKERERDRAEAATKRKGRAERRRGDDSDAAEEPQKANVNIRSGPSKIIRPASVIKTPPENNQINTSRAIPRKNSRTVNKRGKFGRNPGLRERDAINDTTKTDFHGRSMRGAEDNAHSELSVHQTNVLSNGTKPSKPRHMNPNRTSMNELRKRAAGILEFISQVQRDMAGEKGLVSSTPVNGRSNSSPDAQSSKRGANGKTNNNSKLSKEVQEEVGKAKGAATVEVENSTGAEIPDSRSAVDEEAFTKLSAKEMMDVLSREVVFWQKDHGKWGER